MKIVFDPAKDASNLANHGLSLTQAAKLEWRQAVTKPDNRIDYGEARYVTYAPLHNRIHALVWTPRDGNVRAISLRKANIKEVKRYEKDRKKEKN